MSLYYQLLHLASNRNFVVSVSGLFLLLLMLIKALF